MRVIAGIKNEMVTNILMSMGISAIQAQNMKEVATAGSAYEDKRRSVFYSSRAGYTIVER